MPACGYAYERRRQFKGQATLKGTFCHYLLACGSKPMEHKISKISSSKKVAERDSFV